MSEYIEMILIASPLILGSVVVAWSAYRMSKKK